tara:strand:- start:237 stop:716 length:480 start_codon:yes stop_codon:yes gene_type:complete
MKSYGGRVLFGKMDNYNTPVEGWEDVLQFVDKQTPLWLPFFNDGSAKELVKGLGYNDVFHEDRDYFTYWENDRILIDNPPFSLKRVVIDYAWEKKKPFCLLLPLDTLERKYFKKYVKGLQIIIPAKRYSYTDDKVSPPFKSVWFCWGMNIQNNEMMIFL